MIIEGNYVSDYISYSQLKVFDEDGPKGLLQPKTIDNKGTRFGTLLDDYLFLDKEDFNDRYEVIEGDIPQGDEYKLALVIKNYFNESTIDAIAENESALDTIVDLIKANRLFTRVSKRETFISKRS